MKIFKEKECKLCGEAYTPTSPKQKYCVSCVGKARKDAQRVRDKKRNRLKHNTVYNKVCPICEKEFNTYDSKRKYCGDKACEEGRVRSKNARTHLSRDRDALLRKGRLYYKNNKEKCLLAKACDYRERNPDAAKYSARGKFRNSYEYIKAYIEDRGYTLVSTSYVNNRQTLELICPEGHIWKTTFHQFSDSGERKGTRCASCYQQNNYVSKPEQMVRTFIEQNFPDVVVVYNDRSVVTPKELDLYFPDHNLAIEVCGLYWHGELSSGKSRSYHYDKMIKCYNKGIRLITVFEDELLRKSSIVFSRIRQALGKPSRRFYARKCEVREIDSKTANSFYKANHVQGASTALVRYGLYHEGELLCVGSLGKIGRKHTSTDDTIELKRFCTLPGVSVVGGVGKIFKLMKNFAVADNYTIIKSYCDMRYANIHKPVYEILGFELEGHTKYTPHYFKNTIRYRNFSLRKTPEERLTGLTEWELRQQQGYDRIWDCGHRTYIFKLK